MNTFNDKFLAAGLFWLRVLTGLGMAYHGYGKVFGDHMQMLVPGVEKLGFPQPVIFAWLAALSEFAGGILIAIGLGTRIAAFFIFVTMSVAAFVVHAQDAFNVKELALAYWTVSGVLILTGAGAWSLDELFSRRGR
jgi:putative oxidoreductase